MASSGSSDVWAGIETRLLTILRWKQNEKLLHGKVPEARVRELMAEIRSGFLGDPTAREVAGCARFLRAAALPTETRPDPYGGWWFTETAFVSVRERVAPWPMLAEHRRNAEGLKFIFHSSLNHGCASMNDAGQDQEQSLSVILPA